MVAKLGECKECGAERYIVNRKHFLCMECNAIRLHTRSGVEAKKRKQEELLKKARRGSSISKKSGRQKESDRELHAVYEKMKEGEMVCSGCGYTKHLSHSHIIPRSRRKDLETVRENITYHCLVRADGSEGCHQRHEHHGKRMELNDYEKNMAFIKRVDPEYYFIIKFKEREGE